MGNEYYVKLDAFEGPLDLLLHLIKKHEIDIYDIPVAEITEQYTEFINKMKEFELNIASEYLVMAATLLALKSHMLLPNQTVEEDNETYVEDPREELVQRLLAYKKYKDVAKTLQCKEEDDGQTFMRFPHRVEGETKLPQEPQASVQDMIKAFKNMLSRKEWNRPLQTKIETIAIPIEKRMEEIIDQLQRADGYLLFEQLYVLHSRPYVIATFIALLELLNNNTIICEQAAHFDSLYIFLNNEHSSIGKHFKV